MSQPKPIGLFEAAEKLLRTVLNKGTALDIANLAAEVYRASQYDELTQLYNVGSLKRMAEEVCGDVGSDWSFIYCDVNGFKHVNDIAGHPEGDSLLRQIGAGLAEIAEKTNSTAFRIGGDEFALLIKKDGVDVLLSQLTSRFTSIITDKMDENGLVASLSFGVSSTDQSEGFSELKEHAEAACSMAKFLGAGKVVLWEGIDDEGEIKSDRGRCPKCGASIQIAVRCKKIVDKALNVCCNCREPQ